MKSYLRFSFCILFVLSVSILLTAFFYPSAPKFKFPYKNAGLTERQAAAHLLNRFTYGAKPGEIDAVLKTGLEKWFVQQLKADLKNDSLDQILNQYPALKLSNTEVLHSYPQGNQVLKMAVKDGIINKDSVNKATDRKAYRSQIEAYMIQKGLKPQQELYRQFINQKIMRAAYSNNQLQEILTDFWFNHFNVSLDKNQCAEFIPAYERDVIKPNVLGKFNTILLATAKSPAMLRYLDNFTSVAPMDEKDKNNNSRRLETLMQMGDSSSMQAQTLLKLQKVNKTKGLNENYAREVMELHTLGVDGGYTQQDVTQAARVLTGWTLYPMNEAYGGDAQKRLLTMQDPDKLKQRGFVVDGDFLFNPNRHDKNEKSVLGKRFPANGGYEEGVELLNMLAQHPSTARFISKKLAVRFVSDNPPQSLIDKMAKTFTEKDGDIKEVLITMVTAPEFWSKDALREKTKSPFELAISAVRSLNAEINQPYQLFTWINKMGQKIYYYQAPTGFPDRGSYWINTGSLLNRMNFGLALASQRIPGVKVNLAALNHNREPESAEAALTTYSKLIMPERDVSETVKRLTPMLNDPKLGEKVEEAAGKTSVPMAEQMSMMNEDAIITSENGNSDRKKDKTNPKAAGKFSTTAMQTIKGNNSMLAQVVGVIIGSPEFQRK